MFASVSLPFTTTLAAASGPAAALSPAAESTLTVVGAAAVFGLLFVVPVVVLLRDVRSGRQDPGYQPRQRPGGSPTA